MKTNFRIDHELLAIEAENSVSGMLELIAPEATTTRLPLHIALVIDKSGSMRGGKLEAAKEAANYLVQRLTGEDRLAIIAFDDEVELILPLDTISPDKARRAIAEIHSGGSTNLSGGWLKGLEELGRGAGIDATRRVLLLTDGQANVGIKDDDGLVRLADGSKAQTATTTFGFGDGFNEDLLKQIAETSGGSTYFIETPEDAPGAFDHEFEGLATIVAQNLSVEIVMLDDAKFMGVLNNYKMASVPNGIQTQVGDIYGGERRQILFKFFVPEVAQLGVKRVADITIRYTSVGSEIAQHQISVPVTVNLVSADEAAAAEVDHEVVELVTILEASQARIAARDLADRGDFGAAWAMLNVNISELRSRGTEAATFEADLLAEHLLNFERGTYDSGTRKRMSNESNERGQSSSRREAMRHREHRRRLDLRNLAEQAQEKDDENGSAEES